MVLNEFQIGVDGAADREPVFFSRAGRAILRLSLYDAGANSVQLQGFAARSIQGFVELADREPPPLARLIPFKVIAAFGMQFLASGDEDAVTQKFPIAFRDRSEFPYAINMNFLEKVDAFGVLPDPAHFLCLV